MNYKGQKRIVVMNADKDFTLASGDELRDVQVDTDIDLRYPYEFMIIFVRKISEVRNIAPVALHNLTDDGMLWFCYQKKSSKKGSSDLDRDHGWKPLNDMDFYPNSVLGFQLQVPILASGLRSTRIKRAKIDLDKAENTRALVSDQLLLQEKQLRYNLISSNEQYRSQKENADVAARILQSFENKYNQGMASSLELTQANSNYLTAQNNYLTALLNLLQTKVAYDKLMNKL